MKKIIYLLFLFVLVLLCSCNKEKSCGPCESVSVYKTTGNYKNKAFVILTDDKKSIAGFYDYINPDFPIRLKDGYYLHCGMHSNAGFLSITPKDYNENILNYMQTVDVLNEMVIDTDPFVEYYFADNNENLYNHDSVYNNTGLNITYINQLIEEGNLEKEFGKIK